MSGIVCALRGGPASQPTLRRAIALAQETGQEIHFLYVVNLDFLSHTASSRIQTIEEEMRQMGEFILLAAQAQAEQQGVQAHGVVRVGSVGEQIIALCRDVAAAYVVLGRPQGSAETDVFSTTHLQGFAATLVEQTGVQVVFSEQETR
ncbi:MAG: hypothetical protein Fur0018_15740 [Anaerolineales bacterium]